MYELEENIKWTAEIWQSHYRTNMNLHYELAL